MTIFLSLALRSCWMRVQRVQQTFPSASPFHYQTKPASIHIWISHLRNLHTSHLCHEKKKVITDSNCIDYQIRRSFLRIKTSSRESEDSNAQRSRCFRRRDLTFRKTEIPPLWKIRFAMLEQERLSFLRCIEWRTGSRKRSTVRKIKNLLLS